MPKSKFSPRTKPKAGRTAPGFHALASYQAVLDFANAKITVSNYLDIIGGGIPNRQAMKVNCTLAGDPLMRLKAAEQLQECVRRALSRFVNGEDEPLRASLTTSDPDFLVGGRLPFGLVDGKPVAVYSGQDGVHAAANDLQDAWYLLTAELVRQHQRYAALPPHKRLAGWTDRVPPPGITGPGPRPFLVSFRPLAICEAPRCGPPPHFFFRKRAGEHTCSERCSKSLDYEKHKAERFPPGRPRHQIAIPPPRAKRRPA